MTKHFWSYEHMAVTFKNYHISPIIVQQYYRNKNTDELVHKKHMEVRGNQYISLK